MVKANVDKILDLLKERKSLSTTDLAKQLGIKEADILKSAEYLEQDGVIKIERKWPKTLVTIKESKPSLTAVPPPPPSNKKLPVPPSKIESSTSLPLPPSPSNTLSKPPSPESKLPVPPKLGETQTTESNTLSSELIQTQVTQEPEIIETTKITTITSQDSSFQNQIDNNIFEDKKLDEPHFIIPSSEENIHSATTLMSQDPLNQKPSFDLEPPSPTSGAIEKPVLSYSSEFSPLKHDFPSYIHSDYEKIDFLVDQLSQKISSRDYSDLNKFYRDIYVYYNESNSISPNERYLLGEKIQEIFDRIKKIYLVEKAI